MLRVGSSAHTLGSGRFVTWRAHTPAEARLDVSLAIVEEVRLHVLPARRQMTREDFSQRIRAGDGGGIPIRSPPQSVLRRRRRVAAGIWLRDVPFTLRDPKCDGPAGRPRWQRASKAGSHVKSSQTSQVKARSGSQESDRQTDGADECARLLVKCVDRSLIAVSSEQWSPIAKRAQNSRARRA